MLRDASVIAFARVREFARVDEIGVLFPRLELNRAGELAGGVMLWLDVSVEKTGDDSMDVRQEGLRCQEGRSG